jgi:cystathionine beta-lyase/cystathionine gamma-synthase
MSGSDVIRTIAFELGDVDSADKAFSNTTSPSDFVYSRLHSPTVHDWERFVAGIEGAQSSVAVASGMAAIDIALSICQQPDMSGPWLMPSDIYSGSRNYVRQIIEARRGIPVAWVEINQTETASARLIQAIHEMRPSVVYLETISNPWVSVIDGPAIVKAAKAAGARVIIDNTLATPFLCKPLDWGADIVVHSATKYLGGHNDTLAGVISTNDPALYAELVAYRSLVGAVLSPDNAARLNGYSRTFELRVQQQNQNAARIAAFLNDHPQIAKVHYPCLASPAQRALATKVLGGKGFGAILTFSLKGGRDACQQFMKALDGRLPHLGTLGDVETSLLHIESSFRAGFSTDAFRLSAGIEDSETIIDALQPALDALNKAGDPLGARRDTFMKLGS